MNDRLLGRKLSRRHALATAAGTAGLALVGCGDDDDATDATDATASPAAAGASASATQAPKVGGKFRMATRTFDVSLDPHQTNRPELIYVWQSISHPLLELDSKNEVNNEGVAEKFEVPDNLTLTFKLWPGIKFHDIAPANGRAFTSDDVKYSLERMSAKGAIRASLFSAISSIQTPDPTTITLKLSTPSVPLLYFLGSTYNVMVSREAVEQFGDLKTGQAAIGVGPFMTKSLTIENGASLVKNPNYFRSGLPYLDSLEFIPVQDPAVALPNAFRAGESELVSVRGEDLSQLKSQVKDLSSERVGSTVPYGMLFNHAVDPWKDLRVRKAFHLAIDRAAIGEAIGGGDQFMVAPIMLPLAAYALPEKELLTLPGYRPNKDQDIADAKQLLRSAGFANDFKDFSFTLQSSNQSNYSEQWELLGPQLQKLGAKVELKPMEHTAFKASEAKKDFSTEFSGFLVDSEPDSPLTVLHHSTGSRNYVNYKNPTIDALIEKQRVEFDRNKRVDICLDASRKLIEDVAYAWTVTTWSNMARHNYLKGYSVNPTSVYESNFTRAWFDKA